MTIKKYSKKLQNRKFNYANHMPALAYLYKKLVKQNKPLCHYRVVSLPLALNSVLVST